MDKKKYSDFERIFKGVASRKRVEILVYIDKHAESSVGEIAVRIGLNFRTASEHIRKLVLAGLVMKRSDGVSVRHALTVRGKNVFKFIKTLE